MTSLPTISVRDLVLFPGGSCSIMVGRDFTVTSLKAAIESHDGKVIVTTQKLVELNDRPNIDEIYQTGTICKIVKSVEFPDGTMKVALEAQCKFQVHEIIEKDGLRIGRGQAVEQKDEQFAISENEKMEVLQKISAAKVNWDIDIDSMVAKLEQAKDSLTFLMSLGNIMSLRRGIERELSIDQVKEGIFFVDTLSREEQSRLNIRTSRLQEILESKSAESILQKMNALI